GVRIDAEEPHRLDRERVGEVVLELEAAGEGVLERRRDRRLERRRDLEAVLPELVLVAYRRLALERAGARLRRGGRADADDEPDGEGDERRGGESMRCADGHGVS